MITCLKEVKRHMVCILVLVIQENQEIVVAKNAGYVVVVALNISALGKSNYFVFKSVGTGIQFNNYNVTTRTLNISELVEVIFQENTDVSARHSISHLQSGNLW